MSGGSAMPDALEVQPDGIADELADLDRWLVWKFEKRDGDDDWTKLPYEGAGAGHMIDATDPENGVALDVAVRTYRENDEYAGIGFILDADDMIAGFDFDDVRDPERPHDSVPDVVAESITDLDTYTEVSPSGTGYRCFVRGVIPGDANRGDLPCDPVLDDVPHLEVYDGTGGRYLTVTGHVEGTETVETRPQETKELYNSLIADDDENSSLGDFDADSDDVGSEPSEPVDLEDRELIERAKNAENGDEFTRLWNGDTSRHSNDHSRADQALCNHLAFWTGKDRQRIDRLFRDSGLCRDKWTDRRDYRQRTIDNAIRSCNETYDPESSGSPTYDPTPDAVAGDDDDSDADADSGASSGAAPSWETVREYYGSDEVAQKGARQAAAQKLLAERDFATTRETEEMYIYDDETGVFIHGAERDVERVLNAGLGPHYTQHEKREILGKIKAETYVSHEDFDAGEFDEPLLCVGNGVINVETREFYDHDPEYLFTTSIPWHYDPDAEAPNLERFMDEITRREGDKKTMYEMVGHALHPEYIRKKFMILYGAGDNGKSVFYKFVRELLGGLENISGVPLQTITEGRFAAADVVGNLANIAPDMDAKKIADLGDLKSLTGGEDPFYVEPKGKEGYEVVNGTTMMFGCNEPPVLPERGRKIETRIVPIELPYRFVDEPTAPLERQRRDVHELEAEIVNDEEMSGFLNLALDGLERLIDQGDVSLPESPSERLEMYEKSSDPIKNFALDHLERDEGSLIPKDVVYNVYTEFCRENDTKVADRGTFFRELNQTSFPVETKQSRKFGDGRTRCLAGASFAEHVVESAAVDHEFVAGGVPADTPAIDAAQGSEVVHNDLEDMEPGVYQTPVVVEVSEIDRSTQWNDGEGWMADQGDGLMRFVVDQGGALNGVDVADKVEIRNFSVEKRNGVEKIVLSKITEVEQWTPDDKQSGLDDDHDGGDGSADRGDGGDSEPTNGELKEAAQMAVAQARGNAVDVDDVHAEIAEEFGVDRDRAAEAAQESRLTHHADSGVYSL